MIYKRVAARLRAQDWLAITIEVVIVIVGVFIGTQVSNWNHERLEKRDMLANKERADAQIAFLAATSIAYGRVVPCMEQRVIEVMRDASRAGEVERQVLIRPILWNMLYNEMTSESFLNMRDTFGPDVSEHYERIAYYADLANGLVESLANDWEALSIISPDSGDVGQGDRQQARILASRMRSTLRSLGKMSSNIAFRARKLSIAPALKRGQRMPADCTDLWRWNAILYDPLDVPADRRDPPNLGA